MKRKPIKWIVLLFAGSFALFVTGGLYVINEGNPVNRLQADRLIPPALAEKGFKKEDIRSAFYVEPKHLINKEYAHGHYQVIFEDEPHTVYYYGYRKKDKGVDQFCEWESVTAPTGKPKDPIHLEQACVSSYDNR